jgi:hypothetical protein
VKSGMVHCLSCTRLICKRCGDINSVMCQACHEAGPPFEEDCMSRLTDEGLREAASVFIPSALPGGASPQARSDYNVLVARRIAAIRCMCPGATHLLRAAREPGEPAQAPFREKYSRSGNRPRCQLCGAQPGGRIVCPICQARVGPGCDQRCWSSLYQMCKECVASFSRKGYTIEEGAGTFPHVQGSLS